MEASSRNLVPREVHNNDKESMVLHMSLPRFGPLYVTDSSKIQCAKEAAWGHVLLCSPESDNVPETKMNYASAVGNIRKVSVIHCHFLMSIPEHALMPLAWHIGF
ncbi:UNVERIFIED_CONTAM: hypothetical protein Sindi_1606800 [Sesamum indicum]